MSEDFSQLLVYSDVTVHPEITQGKAGGYPLLNASQVVAKAEIISSRFTTSSVLLCAFSSVTKLLH